MMLMRRAARMLSVPHLIIIFLVALIVLGPEKLPEVARTLSKAMLEFRSATSGMRETLEREMRDLEREIKESKNPAGNPSAPTDAPALNPAGGTWAQEAGVQDETPLEPPGERPSEPADTGELAPPTEDSFHAGPAEAAAGEPSPEEGNNTTESVPEKPTDEHPTPA